MGYYPKPEHEMLERHSHLVRGLHIHNDSPAEFFAVQYPNLLLLSIEGGRDLASNQVATLMSLNPTIQVLHLNVPENLSKYLWKSTAQLSNLRHLIVGRLKAGTQEELHGLWNTVSRLESLGVQYIKLDNRPRISGPVMTTPTTATATTVAMDESPLGLRDLTMAGVLSLPIEDQLDWIARFPSLRRLRCNSGMMFPTKKFSQLISEGAWPELEELNLKDARAIDGTDQFLSDIIRNMGRVVALEFTSVQFGELSFQSLRPHFHYIRKLHLQQCPQATSGVLLDLLASCPQLKELTGDRVLGREIVEDNNNNQSRPWICAGSLTTLEVYFETDDDPDERARQHHTIFERVSTLTSLEVLRMLHYAGGSLPAKNPVEFRLHRGLGKLASLKNLKHLSLHHGLNELQEEDAQWMVDHWRNLDTMIGSKYRQSAILPEIKAILKRRGILYH
ncbi:hypothetical protein BGX28_006887 [Mortierella sp. GBA30]|nr:hypothetical protein BGX28_006887 [Mortierella sp. GBA30]